MANEGFKPRGSRPGEGQEAVSKGSESAVGVMPLSVAMNRLAARMAVKGMLSPEQFDARIKKLPAEDLLKNQEPLPGDSDHHREVA